MNSILVLCEGNVCRSPMAQALIASALPEVEVRSAGLGALIGMPADERAIRLMKERGLDISGHRAQQVNRQMCLSAEMVLVMDTEQRQQLEGMYPQARGRAFRLGEYTQQDIRDPYRLSDSAFRESLRQIDKGLEEWLKRIRNLRKEAAR